MNLIEPSDKWKIPFVEMAQEYGLFGELRYQLAINDFDAYLRKVASNRADVQPLGRVPGTEYWLEDAGRILGRAQLRFRLTAELEHEGGHVGYDVRPLMRRRGYGTQLLQLALPILQQRGVCRVRVTCDDDNIGSAKIIEKNGGVLAGKSVSYLTGKRIRQYWIELKSLLPRDIPDSQE